jgi:hypothetical protein
MYLEYNVRDISPARRRGKKLTRVAFPIKVILGVAVAFQVQSGLLASWAVGEWYMVVRNVVEEMNLVLVEQKTCCNRVDWRISPSLVEEATFLVEMLEVVKVRFRSKPV